jgi:Rrp15p
MLKNSFANAFQTILNRKVDDDKVDQPILAKYKRPSKEVSEEMKRESELRQKRGEKERLRLMGRHIPTAEDEEHEREL